MPIKKGPFGSFRTVLPRVTLYHVILSPARPRPVRRLLVVVAIAVALISACGGRDDTAISAMDFADAPAESGETPVAGAPTALSPGAGAEASAHPAPEGGPAGTVIAGEPADAPVAAAQASCPRGGPVGQIEFFRATRQPGAGGDQTVWLVVARGVVENEANAAVEMAEFDIELKGTAARDTTSVSLKQAVLERGETAKWSTMTVVQGATEPEPIISLYGNWAWHDPALKDRCPVT